MTTTTTETDVMAELNDKTLRLRCFEMSLQIKQQESMHRFQMWNQTGKQGEAPELHTMDDVFAYANEVYDFITDVE
tara:strand:- start:124 stop:351 length:228 start_codon:yes stop_codon:yes gene_type:complete